MQALSNMAIHAGNTRTVNPAEPPIPSPSPHKPDAEFIVNDLDTLKVLADPLRLQIVELITQSPRTVKQVAAVLNMQPTKLYYHIKLLEEKALIRVVDTRIVSGIVEKQYQAAALNFRVNRELFKLTSQAGKEGLNVMLTGLFDDIREDIQQSVEAEVLDVSAQEDSSATQSMLLLRQTLHLTPEHAAEFHQRLRALVREYAQDDAQPEQDPYGLLITVYPTIRRTPDGRT
ncbi:MAG: winged helix-turn-helix transcriptional regulator [Anaerolineae bacterium]|nr:winged helix-turn-helix transcriptional regulator [Anaerolineae bacterium]